MSSSEDFFVRLEQLNEAGAALSRERHITSLLDQILLAAKRLTRADGGTLYRMSEDRQALRFEILHTDSWGLPWAEIQATGLNCPICIYLTRPDSPTTTWWLCVRSTTAEPSMWRTLTPIQLMIFPVPASLTSSTVTDPSLCLQCR